MKCLIGIIALSHLFSCNTSDKNQNGTSSDSLLIKKDSLIETSTLSDQHRDAQNNLVGTWRIYKDVSRDGEKCDSLSIKNGSCSDKNTNMITFIALLGDGKYNLNYGFTNNHPSEDNGTWKVSGTKYGIDVLLLESHTTKSNIGSSENAVTVYIIQNASLQHLVLVDAEMFNTMYFIPDPKNIN